MHRTIALLITLLIALLILSGCGAPASPPLAPAVSAPLTTLAPTPTRAAARPTPTPWPTLALPQAADVADWILTTQELAYIRQYRYVMGYFPNRLPPVFDVVNQAVQDPAVLSDNRWRAAAALAAVSADELSAFFGGKSPSVRFASIVARVKVVAEHLAAAGALLNEAVNRSDGALLERAAAEVQAAQAEAKAIDALFMTLVGPSD